MAFSELHKHRIFVNCFFFFPLSPVIFVCWVEIKMAFWEKLSCQWLHCLSRIVVINFTRTWSTGALSWRRGVWAAEPGPLFTLLSVRADSLVLARWMRQEILGRFRHSEWLKRLRHPRFKYTVLLDKERLGRNVRIKWHVCVCVCVCIFLFIYLFIFPLFIILHSFGR